MAIYGKSYKRPNSAATKYAADKIFIQLPTRPGIEATAPAFAAVLPASQAYVAADEYAENVICGGTVLLIGAIYGVLMQDTKESTTAPYATTGRVYLKLTAAITPVQGQPAYIVDATGLAHDTAAAGRTKVGTFSVAGVVTDPPYLPTGSYAIVDLNQVP